MISIKSVISRFLCYIEVFYAKPNEKLTTGVSKNSNSINSRIALEL